ncbi:uncharacterized protein LOC122093863 [Macadamia integrifolia]|uniref:uncharacterized protein LOC122093863 n=1 Tax=Macadamia integrifolia TaxID=60698 RepID=UPI001C533721|nr:uncharacterized protein LOC122093863 [Macadamia integrifolia]
MIEMIYDRLDFIEKLRFTSICVSWRNAVPEFTRYRLQKLIPWLLFSHDTETREIGFLNLVPENMIHLVRIPQIDLNLCRGSIQGWLFIFSNSRDGQCFLFNPFSKVQIALPPFILRPWQSVFKVILSSNPKTNEDWMVVAYIPKHELLFYKSGDKSWSIGPTKSKVAFSYGDGDIISCGGDQVYALGLSKTLWVFDMRTHEHILIGGGVSPLYDLYQSDESIDRNGDGYICYLVESNRQLFMIARFLKNVGMNSYHYTTYKFLFYKMKKNNNKELRMDYAWVRQSSLGADRALFLSRVGSKFVSTTENPEIHNNSIYFTNDLDPRTGKPCDIGIYHVEDDLIEPFIVFDDLYSLKFPSVWVTPSV